MIRTWLDMGICKNCKKREEVYVYTYMGEKHCFHSLSDLIMLKCQKEEDEKGFWKSSLLKRYSFQTGFNEGVFFGVLLNSFDHKDITIKKEATSTKA